MSPAACPTRTTAGSTRTRYRCRPDRRHCIFDNPTTRVWYDFVHHIRFSATGDGFHEIRMCECSGPTRKSLDKHNINTLINTSELSYLVIGVYHDPRLA